MKSLFLLPLVVVPILLSGCETTVVERHPRRGAYVAPVDDRTVVVAQPRRRRDVVVVEPGAGIRYYTDARGRYYIQNGRRIYVNY